jgi:hypothetical protein
MLPFLIEKYLLFILFRHKKRSCMKKINVIAINMKTSNITLKIVILQKIIKKNQWIWSYYVRETLVSNFNCRLKRKNDGGKRAHGAPRGPCEATRPIQCCHVVPKLRQSIYEMFIATLYCQQQHSTVVRCYNLISTTCVRIPPTPYFFCIWVNYKGLLQLGQKWRLRPILMWCALG